MMDNTENLQTSRRKHPEGLAAASALQWGGTETVTAEDDEKKQDTNGKEEPDLDEIHYTSATTLAALIRAGDVSPVDLIDMTLQRLKERDDQINAFVTVTGQRARKAAKEAERAVENGEELGPLHGIPIAVKDLQPVKDVRWTSGVLPLADRVADETETVVKRLFDAGAILIGKTNTPEYGYPGKTDNLLTGATSTPFDLDSNSGGSSGGSASAVASGIVSIATGTDGAGSIRIPASFCSTYGFKSTYRRLPGSTFFETGTTFKSNAAETRTVRDAALALSVMAGPSDTPEDPHILPNDDVNYLEAVDRGVEDISVGYSPDLGVYPVDDRVRNVVGASVEAISDAGATVEQVDVDLGVTYDELIHSLRIMRGAAYSTLPEKLATYDIDVLGADRDKFPDKLIELIEFGREKISMVDLKRNDETVRTSVFNGIQAVFEDYDILVTPTVAVPPFPNSIAGPSEINGMEIDPILGWLITAVFNMTGNPAASIPAGFTDEGLPVGMQLVGERLADESVLAASAAYERVNPWHENYKAITQTADEKIKTGKKDRSGEFSVSENTTAQDRMTAERVAHRLERRDV
jgi:Asp-tRNA(Asn)/Glu-tRNA(Gln) amidotransferase A subunit family amidase